MGTVTISGSLISHVRKLFRDGLQVLARGNVLVQTDKRNGYTDLALPAYIISVAAVEAFTNETFFGPTARLVLKGTSLYELRDEWIETVDLREKMVILTKLLCGTTLRRGEPPFQDFTTLVSVRNKIVHYKMDLKTPKFVGELNQKKIGLDIKPPGDIEGQFVQPWVWEISSTEGIRWAHNTATRMMRHLIETIPESKDEYQRRGLEKDIPYRRFKSFHDMVLNWLKYLTQIDEEMRDHWWAEAGIATEDY